MKTKDLIRQLQESDPSGEMECVVENADILFVDTEPAYWDGCYQKLIRDENNRIIGGKYCSQGNKVVINVCSISDAIFNYEDFIVEYDSEYAQKGYEKRVEGYKASAINIKNEVAMDFFVSYMIKRFVNSYQESFEEGEIREAATEFFKKNMSYADPMPKDIKSISDSYHNRRCSQWDREITLIFENNQIKIERKV